MSAWSPRRSAYLALSLLAAVPALALPYHIRPRQPLPNVTICTCSSKEKGLSRITGICRAAGGEEVLITVYAEPNEENAGFPPRTSWNECYIPGALKERAIATFSDENCAARFGEGFTEIETFRWRYTGQEHGGGDKLKTRRYGSRKKRWSWSSSGAYWTSGPQGVRGVLQ
ncbi:hypothetical protein QBC38DRAFT_458935 [Podospora fimiseda]|uniref:Uncharacterized protein n=1 Tax=Podospora fimiseda TaxID=252190 RepID=A0AAN7BI61_9PEZI|nr:hypothetical protein QBC38DRAFT_458935 [Podospora fimiseda]